MTYGPPILQKTVQGLFLVNMKQTFGAELFKLKILINFQGENLFNFQKIIS